MEAGGKPGVIINLGSASGLYPMYYDPIYSGSKGWLLRVNLKVVYSGFCPFGKMCCPWKSQETNYT